LTDEAPVGSEAKVYDFDVDTSSLEYLPGVTLGGIVTATPDGSSLVFVNRESPSPELELWSAGPGGGSVSQIVQLPGGGFVGPGRMAANGSVVVFQAAASIAGFNNADSEQVYRYDAKANELSCISCPPTGVRPSGSAYLSAVDQYGNTIDDVNNTFPKVIINDVRGVSNDGQRMFFDSPDPLVDRDTNGKLDAYEWENGTVFLISSGTSSENSFFLDNSQSGGDAFFTTSDELTPGDTDASFDVYDARIPRPGDTPPPVAAPCSGAACQGGVGSSQLLGPPPSSTFDGVGNLSEERAVVRAKSTPKRLSQAQKLASRLRACHKRRSKSKRATCEKQARKRYPISRATAEHKGRRGK
jgi:hypothetical protein